MGGRGGGSSLASKSAAPSVAPLSEEQTIHQLFDRLDQRIISRNGIDQGMLNVVSMARLRDGLRELGWSRDKQDAAIMNLVLARKIVAFPESNQKTLTQKERDDAIHFGNQDKHLISWIRD